MKNKLDTAARKKELLKKVLKIGVKIQHRFKAEPTFGPTGIGYMKSNGVEDYAVKPKNKIPLP